MLSQLLLVMLVAQAPPPASAASDFEGQQSAPAVQTTKPAPAPRKIYNETADAKAQIEAALKLAAEDDIRVLINWGANDDPNCVSFQRASAEMRAKLSLEYRFVTVDVGHFDRNQDLARTYGGPSAGASLPHLSILDGSGKVLARQSRRDFVADAGDAVDPAKIFGFLEKHQAQAPEAQPLYAAAIRKAKAEDKRVFVWFSAPW